MIPDTASDYGLVISEEGYNAETCATENTIFDTRYDTPKALISDDFISVGRISFVFTTTPAVGTTTKLFSVKHKFGYTPIYLAYLDRVASSSFNQLFGYVSGEFYLRTSSSPTTAAVIRVKANATELFFEYFSDVGTSPNMVGKLVVVNYYIFCNDSK